MQTVPFFLIFAAFTVCLLASWPILRTWREQYVFERKHYSNALEEKAATAVKTLWYTVELAPVYAFAAAASLATGVFLIFH